MRLRQSLLRALQARMEILSAQSHRRKRATSRSGKAEKTATLGTTGLAMGRSSGTNVCRYL